MLARYFVADAGVELFSRAGGRTRLRITGLNRPPAFVDYAEVATWTKRMTVVVEPMNDRGEPSVTIRIYCKGADSFVYPFLVG